MVASPLPGGTLAVLRLLDGLAGFSDCDRSRGDFSQGSFTRREALNNQTFGFAQFRFDSALRISQISGHYPLSSRKSLHGSLKASHALLDG